jgi:hypothetical protein
MNFTFGIITTPQSCGFLQILVDSITEQNIPNFEIIVVGGINAVDDDVLKVIPFDESKKKMWITKKKNIVTENAKYENIVFMHDYVKLEPGWYDGFLKFGDDFNVCMNKVKNFDGTRFRDWTLCFRDVEFLNNREWLIPYSMTTLSHLMYISGAYWVAKTEFMKKYPLDESLSWGESEDIEWSEQVRQVTSFKMNENSTVSLLKMKQQSFDLASEETIKKLKEHEKV